MFFLSKYNFSVPTENKSKIIIQLKNKPLELNFCVYNSIEFIDENTIVLVPKTTELFVRNSFSPRIRIEFVNNRMNVVFSLNMFMRLFIFIICFFGECSFLIAFYMGTLPKDITFAIVVPVIAFIIFNIVFSISVKKLLNQLKYHMTVLFPEL